MLNRFLKTPNWLVPVVSVPVVGIAAVVSALSDSSTGYWVGRVLVLLVLSALVTLNLTADAPVRLRRDIAVLVGTALVFDGVNNVSMFPTRSPLPLLASLVLAVVLILSPATTRTLIYRWASYGIVAAWATWIVPVRSVATIGLAAVAIAAPGITAAVLIAKSFPRRLAVLAVAAWAALGLTVLRVWSVGVEFSKMGTEWFGIIRLGLVAAILGALVTLVAQTPRIRKTGAATVLILGVLTTTFTTAEADTTPRQAPIALEEGSVGNGMTGEKGAGPKARYNGISFEDCDRMNKRDCFITYFDQYAQANGVEETLKMIVGMVENNEGATFPKHCHQVVHNLGQMTMESTGQNFTKSVGLDPMVCGTGFVHGMYEQALNALGTTAMFKDTATVCAELGMNNDFYRWTCSHILGHLMMASSMANPTEAMEYCLNGALVNKTDCLAGGWMNFFQDDQILDYVGSRADVKKVFEVCYGTQTGLVKMVCYQEMFPAIYRVTNGDDYAAGKACLDYSEAAGTDKEPWSIYALNYRDRCAQGLARAVAVSSDYDYRRVPPRCLAMPREIRNGCLAAAAGSVVTNTGSLDAGLAVCKYIDEQRYRNYCMFWVKDARIILTQGPNAENLPKDGEFRLPGLAPGIADNVAKSSATTGSSVSTKAANAPAAYNPGPATDAGKAPTTTVPAGKSR